jgi:hypothetical protein
MLAYIFPGGGLIELLIFLIVVFMLLGLLARGVGWWGPGPGPGPGPGWWGGNPVGALISLIVFLVVLGILLRIVGIVW